jgi:hypothetical protein
MPHIDHLVYAVPDLQIGIDLIEQQFGVRPVYGGRHLKHGTQNAILHLGNQCYFEIIAIDPENKEISAPRWMGVDLIQGPTLTRWALCPDDWSRDVQRIRKINPNLGNTAVGNRQQANGKMLNWEMSLPLAEPVIEVIPFLLNWKGSTHPTEELEQNCKLKKLVLEHPNPQPIESLLHDLGTDITVRPAKTPGIIVTIDTPNGEVVIR